MIAELSLYLTVFATGAAAGLEPMIADVEHSVVVGSADVLQQARSELKQDLAGGREPQAPHRYLLAYVDWRLAQLMMAEPKELEKERLRILEEAQEQLESLTAADPDHAEAHALLGSVLGLQIGDSAFKGMRLGPRASAAVDRAYELAPENPRVALARGIGWLNTPRMFGGGVAKADVELRRAEELFAQESLEKAWPFWGRVDTLIWRGQVAVRQDNAAAARALYERALEIEPDHGWIRYQLLPALDSAK